MNQHVYFFEHQLIMPDGAQYLPLASGLLASFIKKNIPGQEIKINANPLNPSAAAFSVSLWNFNHTIQKALAIKQKYPSCRIMFGGPSASKVKALNLFDVIEGEGESQFLQWLKNDGSNVPEIQDLDEIPSPYLSGFFDHIITPNSQAIIETNRGCPFGCAYCFWGKGDRRMKFHSLDYIKAEAEWIGINKIKYVFCADGNFGMFERDIRIAEIYADVKRRYGYPDKFRVCYGKNAETSVFETAKALASANLAKTVTLSPQSRNPGTLEAIGRENIRDSFFDEMQKKYDDEDIPVYSELILGLPEETYESFKDGLLQTMRNGNQLFIYFCESLPGTRLADEAYQKKYGIITRPVLLTPSHCQPIEPQEYEDIVIGTTAMPPLEWIKAAVLGWMVQLYYSFKITDALPEDIIEFCLCEIAEDTEIAMYFKEKAVDMILGKGRCDLIDGIYFEPEEAVYLKYFCRSGVDPVAQVIYARKNNFKKGICHAHGCLHPDLSPSGKTEKMPAID